MSAVGEHEVFDNLSARGAPSIIAAAQELKSPLALIRQLSLTLEDGGFAGDEQQRMLRQISLTSERALRLTGDLTKSIKLADGLFELEPINAKQLCEDIVHDLTPLFAAHECSIRMAPRKQPLLLVANRDLLKRIIVSLSDNALHCAGKDVSVEIRVRNIKKGQAVRLAIRDYGPAVPKNAIESLENKITDSTRTAISTRPRSSGLSLYMASQFADVINGEIGMTRHRDGSTFYVDLQSSRQLSLL
jgi:K+-sensing histidine kinase KdpD